MKKENSHNSAAAEIIDRRQALKGAVVATGVAATVPTQWIKPVVDAVVLPAHAVTSGQNIVQIAAGAADFTTLVSALGTADLVSTLEGPGPFTVFAPTNAAFDNIASVVAGLDVATLTTVLLYHVVSGIQPPSAIPATTGAAATVGATIEASNGVIYVIDEVLLP